jgi:hypothetical protein
LPTINISFTPDGCLDGTITRTASSTMATFQNMYFQNIVAKVRLHDGLLDYKCYPKIRPPAIEPV